MKNLFVLLCLKFLSYSVMVFSGWRSVCCFGYPPKYDKRSVRSYMVTSGDGTIIDHCIYHGIVDGKHLWQQAGLSSSLYPYFMDVTLWKPVSRIKGWSSWYSRVAANLIRACERIDK